MKIIRNSIVQTVNLTLEVISVTGLLTITMVLAIASLAVGTTIQTQAKSPNANSQYIDNRHSHTSIPTDEEDGEIKGNEVVVQNTDESHTNTNFNYNRGDTFEERSKVNTHDKPNTGGNSDKGDETGP